MSIEQLEEPFLALLALLEADVRDLLALIWHTGLERDEGDDEEKGHGLLSRSSSRSFAIRICAVSYPAMIAFANQPNIMA